MRILVMVISSVIWLNSNKYLDIGVVLGLMLLEILPGIIKSLVDSFKNLDDNKHKAEKNNESLTLLGY